MSESSISTELPIKFTRLNSEKILALEKEIAYFFGAKDPELIAKYYMQAIQILEEQRPLAEQNALQEKMQPFLEKAYLEVQKQTGLRFDVKTASSFEFKLIFTQSKKANFEDIYDIMVNLYQEIFGSRPSGIKKSALLRTFLYVYKIRVISLDQDLSDGDIILMKNIAKRSEEELDRLASKAP